MLKGQKLTTEMRKEKYQVLILKDGERDLVKSLQKPGHTHGFCSVTQRPDASGGPGKGQSGEQEGRGSGHLAVNIRTGPGSAAHQPPGCPQSPGGGRGRAVRVCPHLHRPGLLPSGGLRTHRPQSSACRGTPLPSSAVRLSDHSSSHHLDRRTCGQPWRLHGQQAEGVEAGGGGPLGSQEGCCFAL